MELTKHELRRIIKEELMYQQLLNESRTAKVVLDGLLEFAEMSNSAINKIKQVAGATNTGRELVQFIDNCNAVAKLYSQFKNNPYNQPQTPERAGRYADKIAREFAEIGAGPARSLVGFIEDGLYPTLGGIDMFADAMNSLKSALEAIYNNKLSRAVIADALEAVM